MRGAERGQAPLGTALVMAITIMAATATVGVAVVTLEEARGGARVERAETAVSEFDSTVSLVALGRTTTSDRVELGLTKGEHATLRPGGRLYVEVIDDGTVEETLVNRSLGALTVETGGSTVVYEGGAVWRYTGETTRMVSPPELFFRDRTLTAPVLTLNVTRPRTVDGPVVVEQATTFVAFPNASRGNTNPVSSDRVRVRVTSRYYEGWETYFRTRIGGDVTVDDANQTVTVELVTPVQETIDRAIAGTAGSGFRITGSGGSPSFVDSYTSADGNGYDGGSDNGTIAAAGDIILRGDATVYGDAVVPPGYDVSTKGNSEVTGSIRHDELNIPFPRGRVQSTVGDARETNDNDETSVIEDGDLNRSSSMTLGAGTYYLDGDLDLDSHTLHLDTSGGNVTLAVNGDVSIGDGGKIALEGASGIARVYVNGDEFGMNGGEVTVPGDRAERFWLYGRTALEGSMNSGAQFTGVYYAPSKRGDSTFSMQSHAEVFGAVVAGDPDLRSGSTIHFDRALRDDSPYVSDATLVTYLHVSINEVDVEG